MDSWYTLVMANNLPAIINYSMVSDKFQQLDGLESVLDKLNQVKHTTYETDMFIRMVEDRYESICYDGPANPVTVLIY